MVDKNRAGPTKGVLELEYWARTEELLIFMTSLDCGAH